MQKILCCLAKEARYISRLHAISPPKVFLNIFFLLSSDAEDVSSENC